MNTLSLANLQLSKVGENNQIIAGDLTERLIGDAGTHFARVYSMTRDVSTSSTRNTKTAKRFLSKALTGMKSWAHPQSISTDKASAFGTAIPKERRKMSAGYAAPADE